MKRISFWHNFHKNVMPFWQPWGCLGCLGRVLGFLLLLLLLLFLLSLFRGCDGNWLNSGDNPESGNENIVSSPGSEVPRWREPIEGGEEVGLPAPGDNVLPPFEETEPIPNPEDGGATDIYPNLLYVIFDSETNDESFKAFAQKFTSIYPAPDHKIQYYNTGSKTAVLNVPEATRTQICSSLPDQIPEVEFLVVPVEVLTSFASNLPNDPAFSDADKSWYFEPIQAPQAWDITQGNSEIIVGIVDSYMDLNHPELKGDRCIYPYSIPNDNSDVSPRPGAEPSAAGHGTLVTAVSVGNANNNEGSSGIAPKCRFIPVSMGENLNTIVQVEGLLYCMYHGASVINLSCGTYFREDVINRMPIDKQIEYSEEYGLPQEIMWDYIYKLAEKRNVTIVWSAGNSNCYTPMDISKRNSNTIRVAAVDRQLKRADFSNYGNFPEKGLNETTISAPGVAIWGALPNNTYDAWDGTSFSAPIITGVVALIKSQNRDLTTKQIIKILQSTGKPVNGTPGIGNLVQIKDALIKAKQTVSSGTTE